MTVIQWEREAMKLPHADTYVLYDDTAQGLLRRVADWLEAATGEGVESLSFSSFRDAASGKISYKAVWSVEHVEEV